jgi:hypothetical protein
MKAQRLLLIALVFGLLTIVTATPVAAAKGGSGTASVTGTATGTCSIDGDQGAISNIVVDLDRFVSQSGELIAQGTVTGLCTTATESDAFSIPFSQAIDLGQQQATCDILELVLGPLHLDVLGLVVDLNQVVLTIVAESGAGNLLGNLLCAVAGLLDNTAINTGVLATLLNQLLGILGL